MVDRGCDAIPYKDEKAEATLAQLSQEKMTLQEENAGVSAENERLAKRCVDLERAVKDVVAKAQEVGGALHHAQHRMEVLEGDKAELEKSIREVRDRMVVVSSAEERTQKSVEQVTAEKESIKQQLQSVLVELEKLQSSNISLEEDRVTTQNELQSLQLAKDELQAHLTAASEENHKLVSNSIALEQRLEERQLQLDTIREKEVEGPLVEENRLLKSSLSGLQSQLHSVEGALETERATLIATNQARQHAEQRIGELENQLTTLQGELRVSTLKSASGKDEHTRLEKQMAELKATVTSLREEISSAAISRSQLELELRQRQEECLALRKQLDPIQQEKYRLELDNANLSEQIHSFTKQSNCEDDHEEEVFRSELVRRLEEKNDALAQCISSLQSDMMAFQNKSVITSPAVQRGQSSCPTNGNSPKTPKCNKIIVPKDMMEQLNRARAAVKETASIIKAQRQSIAHDHPPNNTQELFAADPQGTSDWSQSSLQYTMSASSTVPPAEISTFNREAIPSDKQNPTTVNRSNAPTTPTFDGRSNLRMQLEEEHMAEKSAIKT
eukprot:scaffold361509_cov70-Cyclotella_meneghiniana.AAC.1